VYIGDSGAVVTPFMHVGTYPTRNFATLGPSELRPPFTVAYGQCLNTPLYHVTAPGRRQTLYIILRFSRVLCF